MSVCVLFKRKEWNRAWHLAQAGNYDSFKQLIYFSSLFAHVIWFIHNKSIQPIYQQPISLEKGKLIKKVSWIERSEIRNVFSAKKGFVRVVSCLVLVGHQPIQGNTWSISLTWPMLGLIILRWPILARTDCVGNLVKLSRWKIIRKNQNWKSQSHFSIWNKTKCRKYASYKRFIDRTWI